MAVARAVAISGGVSLTEPSSRTPAEDQRISVRNLSIGAACLFALGIWSWIAGKDVRVIYRGPNTGAAVLQEGVLVRTEPDVLAIVPRSIGLNSLKPGCRYDFNYAPQFGRGTRDYGFRVVRRVTPVDCPPG
jgi:hypothetical protein